MTVDRILPTISTDPGGVSGSNWTNFASESIEAIWEHLGGVLTNVDQEDVNVVTADLKYGGGFSAYTEPLHCAFIPVATNTGAVTININEVGAVAIVRPDGTSLQAGDLVLNQLVVLIFIQALNKFVYINFVDYSTITAQITQLKKRWVINGTGVLGAGGSTVDMVTLTEIQGAIGDVLVFPSFDNAAIVGQLFDNTDYCHGVGNGVTSMKMTYSAASTTHRYAVRLYKDSTLIGDMCELSTANNSTYSYHSIGDLGYGNGYMYELDDVDAHDYTIKLEKSFQGGTSTTGNATVDGLVELFTPDGKFT